MTCETMTYDYRRKIGVVPGALTVHQKNRVLTANSGQYDGNAKKITLVGDVLAKDTNGNVIRASKVVIGVDENDESVTIPVPTHGMFKTNKAEDAVAPASDAAPGDNSAGTLPPMPVTPPPSTSSGPPPGAAAPEKNAPEKNAPAPPEKGG